MLESLVAFLELAGLMACTPYVTPGSHDRLE
jgi:hypothetical protein